jgi:hypothetical protein
MRVEVSMPTQALKAPFPWFGGKSRAASLIWERFGDVANYVEPFAGSLAVLLARPHEPRVETVNDLDCYLSNFWRAVQADPEAVARHCDWPVNEADLHARHRWLRGQEDFRRRMHSDPHFCDAKIAGWWVWGIGVSIGGAWCQLQESLRPGAPPNLRAHGGGVHGITFHPDQLHALAARLRRVRVLCGDWTRALSRTSLEAVSGPCAVLLDPPYSVGRFAYEGLGDGDNDKSAQIAARVREWAVEAGSDRRLRVALCGYEGEHEMPATWECVAWHAHGGYGNHREDNDNASRERIWFSPACLGPQQASLFGAA